MILSKTDTICDEYAKFGLRERCEERIRSHAVLLETWSSDDPATCLALGDRAARADCIALYRLRWAVRGRKDPSRCPGFPVWWESFEYICRVVFGPSIPVAKEDRKTQVKQVRGRNVLFVANDSGRFDDDARKRGVDTTGWTWNAKFADFDSDEWQDLYVVNGMWRSNKRESNVYFANRGDGHFDNETLTSGLENVLATVSATYVDFDQDGDLDIVTVPIDGPIFVYRNNTRGGNNCIIELRDQLGNHFGIGSRIIVHYGPDSNRHQMREIKSSGGFTSFDPPEAHFGLGSYEEIDHIEIQCSAGTATELQGPFQANHRYRITRRADESKHQQP
jgi:hypothetical protein